MATKRKLADDPNTPYDDAQLAEQIRRDIPFGGAALAAGRFLDTVPARLRGDYAPPLVDQFKGQLDTRAPGEAPTPTPVAPAPRRFSALSEDQLNEAQEFGRAAGTASAGYLGERQRLAPGVRRYGSRTADPSDVYVTVDRNGNRVYTDDANFAASQSRGRLTRRDLAPGMLASDAERTLNDPEGGFTYAPTPGRQPLEGLRQASARTRGGSQAIERALAEAERSQEIADTRAGTRDIDKRRQAQGARLRRSLGLEAEGNVDPRVLIALERLNLDREKFAAEREDKTNEREASGARDALAAVNGVAGLTQAVQAGEIDPQTARDLIATLPGEAGARGARGLRRALLQRRLSERDPFFLGEDEVRFADPASIRRNADGSGTFVEADDGFFDIQREIDLSPEELAEIEGLPDDQAAARERELNIRLRRGY